MRETLITTLSALPAFGGRVFDPHAADRKTAKPYLVLTFPPATTPEPWAEWQQEVEIAVCASRTTFAALDGLCGMVTEAVHLVPMIGATGTYTATLTGIGDDAVDEEWDIIWRALRFAVFGITPLGASDPGTPDPWETALGAWTATLSAFSGWAISTSRWSAGVAIPALLWRVDDVNAKLDTLSGSIILEKRLQGHLRGHGVTEQTAAGVLLVAALAQAKKIVLDSEARTYLTIEEPRYSARADGRLQGQVSVRCSRKISPVSAGADPELLAALHLSYDLK